MSPKISVIIPVYNYAKHLKKTLNSIKNQSFKDFEIIVVDDCSTDDSLKVAKEFTKKVYVNKKNSGPAKTRNEGIKNAKGEIIAFTDSDCIASKDWLKNIVKEFQIKNTQVVMGNTKIPKSTFMGDSISALGFPGGANAGFENMWKVDKNGYTDHITSCNFAVKKEIFEKYGVFDESFPLAGGEDPELSHRWNNNGVLIRYCKNVLINHEPRTSFKSFSKWMIYRGRSNYYFKKKVGKVGGFIKLRMWSSWNITKKFMFTFNIILIIPLIFLSFVFQQWGYLIESKKEGKKI